jgi:hypothetical protein
MDDDWTFKKYGAEMSEGYRIILSGCLLVSTYLSVLHYQSFLGISQSIPSVILHTQSFLGISHFVPSVILHYKSFYTLSHITHSVILYIKSFYTLDHFTL